MLTTPVRVCFVCSGNICRSPTAQVALQRAAVRSGHPALVVVDSAGTGDWHAGNDMDARSRATMHSAGWTVPAHVAKQFIATDFATRDVVVALDSGHYDALWSLAARTPGADAARAKLVLLRWFDSELVADEPPDVGDPYYGGASGFSDVLAQIDRSCASLYAAIAHAVASGADGVLPVAAGRTAQQTERPPV